MSEKTHDEKINEKLDNAAEGVELARAFAAAGQHEDAIECILGAQVAMQSAILTQLMHLTDKIETVELAVSRFDERPRDG